MGVAVVCQVLGCLLLVAGAVLLSPVLGLFTAGGLLLTGGVLAERAQLPDGS